MWQNNRAERDKSHFETRKCISTWQKRLFWSSTPLHFSLSVFSSLWTSAAALCILVCIATVLLGLCVWKKRKLLFYKESIKASSKTGLSEAVLSGKNRTLHSNHMPTQWLHHCTLRFQTLSTWSMSASWINDTLPSWLQSTVEHPHAGCGWRMLLDGPGWNNDVTVGGWHVVCPWSVRAVVPNPGSGPH